MDRTVVEGLTSVILKALGDGDAATPMATTLLVRRYAETGREEVGEALGMALAQGLQLADQEGEASLQGAWLQTFLEAANVCEDDRVPRACEQLAARLQQQWAAASNVADAADMLDASLAYGTGAAAIDELERVVGLAYTPGGGVAHSPRSPGASRGTLNDHVNAARALLTAYAVTGRIPYSMLAEELMQFVLRTPNLEHSTPDLESFLARCQLARVLLRLAGLHQSEEYVQAAVVADSDYGHQAQQTLASLLGEYATYGPHAALYGIAVMEWLASK